MKILAFFVSLSTANNGKRCAKEIYFRRKAKISIP
nr:MAG TPA: hypothetical protein [Caudoviricetes sp.]